MKKFISIFSILIINLNIHAQKVPLNSIVEHFTNTKCSVCASRNPGFLTNKNRFPSLSYISIHPSAPYSSCALSQQNTVTNDARTNFNGVYGSTPRIIINGAVINNLSDYADSNLIKPYLNQFSSFDIKMRIKRTSKDSMSYTTVIKKVDTSSLSTASLFSGNIEDTVFLNGGNGEPQHYNVLRFGIQESINLPSIVNDSVVITKFVKLNTIWDEKRISSFSILQTTNSKQLIQTGKSLLVPKYTAVSALIQNHTTSFSIYPNPSSNYLIIESNKAKNISYTISDILGKNRSSGILESNKKIDIQSLENGIYYLNIDTEFIKFEVLK